jgi:hypothetical protein
VRTILPLAESFINAFGATLFPPLLRDEESPTPGHILLFPKGGALECLLIEIL